MVRVRAGYALTVDFAREILARYLPGWSLVCGYHDGDPVWYLVAGPNAVSAAPQPDPGTHA